MVGRPTGGSRSRQQRCVRRTRTLFKASRHITALSIESSIRRRPGSARRAPEGGGTATGQRPPWRCSQARHAGDSCGAPHPPAAVRRWSLTRKPCKFRWRANASCLRIQEQAGETVEGPRSRRRTHQRLLWQARHQEHRYSAVMSWAADRRHTAKKRRRQRLRPLTITASPEELTRPCPGAQGTQRLKGWYRPEEGDLAAGDRASRSSSNLRHDGRHTRPTRFYCGAVSRGSPCRTARIGGTKPEYGLPCNRMAYLSCLDPKIPLGYSTTKLPDIPRSDMLDCFRLARSGFIYFFNA